MPRLKVTTMLDATPQQVWDDISDVGSHVEWMEDAVEITFTSDHETGVGTTFDCATKVGPFRLMDHMEITSWKPGREMGVRHVGLVEGSGRFTLTENADGGTRFTWDEELRFPWWMGGPLGALVGGRILKLIWRRNLQLLAARFA